jgi:hypothetical protein
MVVVLVVLAAVRVVSMQSGPAPNLQLAAATTGDSIFALAISCDGKSDNSRSHISVQVEYHKCPTAGLFFRDGGSVVRSWRCGWRDVSDYPTRRRMYRRSRRLQTRKISADLLQAISFTEK